jgi:hypothetical protein
MNHRLLLTTRKVIVPGNPEKSELYQLITTPDATRMMPTPDRLMKLKQKKAPAEELAKIQLSPKEIAAVRLPPAEIETIRKWIEAGAPPWPRAGPKPK